MTPLRVFTARRKWLIIGGAAAIAAAAAAAAVVPAAQPGPPRLEYTRLPAPCTMLTAATVARYAPGATGGPYSGKPSSNDRGDGCTWFSDGPIEGVSMYLTVDLYGPSEALARAERAYDGWARARCPCNGETLAKQVVPDLGDQATVLFITSTSGTPAGATPWTVPNILVTVRSGNAVITLQYSLAAGENAPQKPANATLAATAIAMAREVLASLAGHPYAQTAVPGPPAPAAAARSSPGLLYAGPRDPCALVKASTLARYAPGATVNGPPASEGSPGESQSYECDWTVNDDSSDLDLNVTIYATPADAQQLLRSDLGALTGSGIGPPYPGARAVKGLGDQAFAFFQNDVDTLTLYVWSANAVIEVSFSIGVSASGSPSRAAALATDVAAARDVLARLPRL